MEREAAEWDVFMTLYICFRGKSFVHNLETQSDRSVWRWTPAVMATKVRACNIGKDTLLKRGWLAASI